MPIEKNIRHKGISRKITATRCLSNRLFKICHNNLLLKEKIQITNTFHFKLEYPLHVLYDG